MFHFKILFQTSHLNFPESGHMCRLVLHSIKLLGMWVLQNWPSGLIQSTICVVWSFVCLYVCMFAPLQNSNFWRSKKDLVDGPSTNLGQCSDETIVEKIKSHWLCKTLQLPLIGQNHTLKLNLLFCDVFVSLELTKNFSAFACFFVFCIHFLYFLVNQPSAGLNCTML